MKWRLFICADCDQDEGVLVAPVPDDAHTDRACPVDYCPACGDYLSMISMGEVEVAGHSLVHLQMRASS